MAVFLVTAFVILVSAGGLPPDIVPHEFDPKSSIALILAVVCAFLVELRVFRAISRRWIPVPPIWAVEGTSRKAPARLARWILNQLKVQLFSIRWIGINALAAAAVGFPLFLLLKSPVLNSLGLANIVLVTCITDLLGASVLSGLIWHVSVLPGPINRQALISSSIRFAILNVASMATVILVVYGWHLGYDWWEAKYVYGL